MQRLSSTLAAPHPHHTKDPMSGNTANTSRRRRRAPSCPAETLEWLRCNNYRNLHELLEEEEEVEELFAIEGACHCCAPHLIFALLLSTSLVTAHEFLSRIYMARASSPVGYTLSLSRRSIALARLPVSAICRVTVMVHRVHIPITDIHALPFG